jgi:ParB family chromosome partitioning protein
LGRGLDALLGGLEGETPSLPYRHVPIGALQTGRFQPRKDMDPVRLTELADSIRAQGLLQPVVVRSLPGQKYEIIAGERRWRAAQQAGLTEIPVVLREIGDHLALALALIENIQREDLNPLEEAEALQRLIDEFGLTHQQAAEAVGRSRVAVSNLLRLNDLHTEVKRLLATGAIDMGHARALLGLENRQQAEIARRVVEKQLTVRATEELVRNLTALKPEKPKPKVAHDPDVKRLENDLSERIGAPVAIRHAKNGKGKLIIDYASLDVLEGILARIR